jgi:hypothetical protein
LGFLDSLRGLFRRKKRTHTGGLRSRALRPLAARQPLRGLSGSGLSPKAPMTPPAAAATELHPQPMIDRSAPILPPQSPPPPPVMPSPRDSPPPGASATPPGAQGETRYVTALPLRAKTVGVLVAVEGDLEGEVFRVPDGESTLGRSEACEVPLPSEWISREHSKLRHQDGMFTIAPLSDKNPTFVNNERTQGTELKDGDLVKLGRTTFRFRTVF